MITSRPAALASLVEALPDRMRVGNTIQTQGRLKRARHQLDAKILGKQWDIEIAEIDDPFRWLVFQLRLPNEVIGGTGAGACANCVRQRKPAVS
jgi:hypothetical protein